MRSSSLETALEKASRIITDRYGLRLIFQGNGCRTNGRTIFLPSLPDNVPDQILGAIRGWADHECAHAIWTRSKVGKAFMARHGRQAFSILNVLEDARVEGLLGSRYPGSHLNLRDGFQFVVEKIQKGAARKADPFEEFVTALYTRGAGKADQDWVSPEAYALADQCRGEIAALHACRSTGRVAKVALRIWERVKKALPSEQQQANQPEASRQGSQGGPCDGQGTQDPLQGSPSTQSSTGRGGNGAVAQADSMPVPSGPMGQLSSLIEAEVSALCSGDAGVYRPYTTKHDQVEVPEPDPGFDSRSEVEALRPHVAGLRRRLLQTLMAERQSLWLGDKTRGNLDPRALHRLITSSSGRIFRKRVVSAGKDTACTLLLDISSSMNGRAIGLCRQLALVFTEALDVLGFPTEVIGFSTVEMDLKPEAVQETGLSEDELMKRYARFAPLYHAIYKEFDEPWRKVAGRIGRMNSQVLTPLGESLLFAGKRLLARPEKRKVLFCLTDGKPVVGTWNEQVTLDHACQAVERLSSAGIEPIGIGILEACVQEIFPSHAVIHDLSELPRGFMTELCKALRQKAPLPRRTETPATVVST